MNNAEREFRLRRVREKKASLQQTLAEMVRQNQEERERRRSEEEANSVKQKQEASSWWGRTKKTLSYLDPFEGLGSGLGDLADLAFEASVKLPMIAALEQSIAALEEEEARLLGLGSERSEDEQKMDAAKERYKRDLRFKMDLNAGKKLYSHEALQQWKKDERRRILNDESLTTNEQDELLDALDAACVEQKKRIEQDINVYEDD